MRIGDPTPSSLEVTLSCDAVGNKVTERDRRGIEELFVYGRENRLTEQSRAWVLLQGVEYDEVGNKRFETDANGHVTGFEYDERNLLIATNPPRDLDHAIGAQCGRGRGAGDGSRDADYGAHVRRTSAS